MTDVLDAIHEDHANMTKMLDARERQLAVFDAGEAPDYDIVRGVARFATLRQDILHWAEDAP